MNHVENVPPVVKSDLRLQCYGQVSVITGDGDHAALR